MESTLAMAWTELRARVAVYLGWSRGTDYGETAWDSRQEFELNGFVASGLRVFYSPPPLDGETISWEWSFLKPVVTLTLEEGATTMPLPDDFGGFEGQITLAEDGTGWVPIPLTSVGRVYAAESGNATTTGRPLLACEEPLRGTTLQAGQRFQLHVWPTADQAYSLQFQYKIIGSALSGAYPYAYGGAQHAETILESCLAIAENRYDDMGGIHTALFKERLAASVAVDRAHKAQTLGYNADRSDWRGRRYRRGYWNSNPVTINGVTY